MIRKLETPQAFAEPRAQPGNLFERFVYVADLPSFDTD